MTDKQMHIGWLAEIGEPVGSAGARAAGQAPPWCDPDEYISRAQMIERAGVEFLVLAETVRPTLNPSVLVPLIAAETSSLGIVPALAMTDYPPFMMARLLTTLDHMTQGRVGWAVATDIDGSYGSSPSRDGSKATAQPLSVANEYAQVCKELWGSWEPDALVQDRTRGTFADPAKVRTIDHVGEHFRVRGPLNTVPSRQGTPPLVSAMSSTDETDFVSRHAEVVLVTADGPEEFRRVRNEIKNTASEAGRDPDDVKVYLAVSIQVAETPDLLPALQNRGPQRSWPPAGTPSVHLTGPTNTIATDLEELHDTSGADGIVILGTWPLSEVSVICNRVLATLRRRGRIHTTPHTNRSLRETLRGRL